MNDFKQNELIEVRNCEDATWSKRVFIFKHDDFFYCEHSGVKRPLVSWAYARKIKSDLEIDYENDCYCVTETSRVVSSFGTNPEIVKAGRYRKTEELAEITSENMSKRNRLEELTMWLDPSWRDHGIGTEAWYIYVDNKNVSIFLSLNQRNIGQVYMSEKSAKRLAKAFNEGELKIEDYL